MMDFIKLPNQLFYLSKNNKQDDITYLSIKDKDADKENKTDKKNKINEKVFLIFEFLYNNVDRRSKVKFTLEHIITECGYPVDSRKNRSVHQFKKILNKLLELNVISIVQEINKTEDKENTDKDIKVITNFNDLKPKDFIICTFNLEMSTEYFQLKDSDKEKIVSYDKEEIKKIKLLIHYCYICARIYKRANVEGDQVQNGGRAEVWSISYEMFKTDLSETDETIKKYNDILQELKLIFIKNLGTWYWNNDPKKFVHESVNIYGLWQGSDEATKDNLKVGAKQYKDLDQNKDKVFTGKRTYKNNNRQLNGELGAIVKKIKNGTATEKDYIRKKEIEGLNLTSVDEQKFNIMSILDTNPDYDTLSDIYYDKYNNEEIADKYYLLENSLGLLDDGQHLRVSRDYYKWVMANYVEDKHAYYCNCVQAEINKSIVDVKGVGLSKGGKKVVSSPKEDELADIEQETTQGYGQEESWEGNEEDPYAELSYEDREYCSQNYNVEDQTYEITREKLETFVMDKLKHNDELKKLFMKKFEDIDFDKLQGKEIAETTIKVRKFFDEYADKKSKQNDEELFDLDAIAAGDTVINKKTKERIEKIKWKVNDLGYIESDFGGEDLLIYQTYVKPNLNQSAFRS